MNYAGAEMQDLPEEVLQALAQGIASSANGGDPGEGMRRAKHALGKSMGVAAPTSPWVTIDSSDLDLWNEAVRIFLTNPWEYQPTLPLKPGLDAWDNPWGFPDSVDMMVVAQRRMFTQFAYARSTPPEIQWVEVLHQRKLQRLRAAPPSDRDLVVEVDLEVELTPPAPRVWRRVRVSAKTPLATLNDKVRSAQSARSAWRNICAPRCCAGALRRHRRFATLQVAAKSVMLFNCSRHAFACRL